MATAMDVPPVVTGVPIPTFGNSSDREMTKKLPALSRKAWVMLKVRKGPAIYYTLCFAELTGTHLKLSDVKGCDNITADSCDRFELVVECHIVSFTYFSENNRYFIEVRGSDKNTAPIVFMTKNQADLTMKSSEMDYLNWQRMLAASLAIHLLEQKQYLLNPRSLPIDSWEALGKGSFGQVFKAKLNGITPVAVKRVSVEDMMTPGYADEKLHVDFINEALISCTVQGPCLLHFYGIFWDIPETPDSQTLDYYMVSELCEGGDVRKLLYTVDELGNILSPRPRLAEQTVMHLLGELFSGLAYMHQRNVVHRDIKPDNIVLVRPIGQLGQLHHGIVKIIDYGHSRTMPEATKLRAGVLTANDRGTELYRAPETVATKSRSAEYSTKVDIYATGVICWELWTRELPFTEQLQEIKQRMNVEQLVASGVRPAIPASCPPGYAALITWCWEMDPKNRPTAAEALEAIIEPKALSQLPCSTPHGIFSAVATGYWKRDKRLSKDIREAMAALRQIEDLVIDDTEITDCIPRFMELIRDNIYCEEDFLIPLEATVLAMQRSNDSAAAIVESIQACDGSSVLAMLLEGECSSAAACTMGMHLVADLSRRNGGFEGWSRILPSVSEMMTKYASAVELQTYCIKFASNICTIQVHNASISRDANLTVCVLQAAERFSDRKELLAAAARFLTLSPGTVVTQLILRSNLKTVVDIIRTHLHDMPLQTLWLRLLSSICTNALSSIEVVKVKVLPVIMDAIAIHHKERAFCWSALNLLIQITVEPSHAVQAVDLGCITHTFGFIKNFQNDVEITLFSLVVLSHFAEVPALRRKLLDAGACNLFFGTLSDLAGHVKVQKEAFKMACGIARNPKLLPILAPVDQCDVILQSVEAFLHLEQFEPLFHGLELLCLILESEEHMKVSIQLGGPRVLAYALRVCKREQIPEILLTTLERLCSDPECATQIVSAKGLQIMSYALRNPDNRQIYHPIMLCLLALATEPKTCAEMVHTDLLTTLSRLLRREATEVLLLEACVEVISKIAQTKLCAEQFNSSDQRRIIMSIMGSYPDNAKIQRFGQQSIDAACADRNIMSPDLLVDKNESLFKIIIVGDTSVGKTCIVLRACKNVFSTKVKATLGVNIDFAELQFASQRATLQIYDTAGQEQYRAMTNQFYRGCHAALLVYDVNRLKTFENLPNWLAEIQRFTDERVTVAVVGSKCDLQTGRQVKQWRAERWAKSIGALHHDVSAVANIGIHQLFRSLTERLLASSPKESEGKGVNLNLEGMKTQCSGCM